MLKLLLLQPPGSCRIFTRSQSVYPPLGLCHLAAILPKQGDCEVLDAEALAMTAEGTIQAVKAKSPRAVGFTVTSETTGLVESYARALKKAIEGVIVLVGGPQSTAAPEVVLASCPSVDFAFRGEGELAMPALARCLEEGINRNERLSRICTLQGFVSRGMKRSAARSVPVQRVSTEQFGSLPFPTLDRMPLNSYWCPDAKRLPMVTFMTARGCPFRCAFCATPGIIGNQVRGWDVLQVADELERLNRECGIREISFVDDLFTAKPRRTRELCQEMIRRNLYLTWFANSRADRLNDDLCHMMKQAGCHQIFLGVESGSRELLKIMKKDESPETMLRGAQFLKNASIRVSAGFIIGLPGETDQTVEETIALAKAILPDRVQFSRWTPLHGSAFVEQPERFPIDPTSAPALTIEGGGYHGGMRLWGGRAQSNFLLSDDGTSKRGDESHATKGGLVIDRVDKWIEQCYAACGARRTGEVDWGSALKL